MTDALIKAAIAVPGMVALVVLVIYGMRFVQNLTTKFTDHQNETAKAFGDMLQRQTTEHREAMESRDAKGLVMAEQCHTVQNRTLDEVARFAAVGEKLSSNVTELGRRIGEKK